MYGMQLALEKWYYSYKKLINFMDRVLDKTLSIHECATRLLSDYLLVHMPG